VQQGPRTCWLCLLDVRIALNVLVLCAWTCVVGWALGFVLVQYEAAKAKGLKSEEETSAAKAKSELDYYIHHFDRYMNHDRARKVAIKQLPDIQVQQETLQSVCGYALSDVTFMRGVSCCPAAHAPNALTTCPVCPTTEAAEQVIKCRQVLKWTYVFGFYLKNETEKHLFEHLQVGWGVVRCPERAACSYRSCPLRDQEQLEKNTENLHGLVEEPLDVVRGCWVVLLRGVGASLCSVADNTMTEQYLDKTRKPDVPFFDHRSNVTNFTAITKKFLNGLLVGVEGGLTESGRAEVAM